MDKDYLTKIIKEFLQYCSEVSKGAKPIKMIFNDVIVTIEKNKDEQNG